MTERRSNTQSVNDTAPVTQAEYGRFIQQLELRSIWLASASVANRIGPSRPAYTKISLNETADWENWQGGFRALITFSVNIHATEEPATKETPVEGTPSAEIKVTFGADYASAIPMTQDVFKLFGGSSLHLNTWPYLREYVSNTTARMNWSDFVAPLYKVGEGTKPEPSSAKQRSSRRRPQSRSGIQG